MYYYIVDPQNLKQKEFERVQHVLYSSLSEYKISGEVMRVTGLRTVQQMVENAFAHEAKTIVAVGNDDTLHDVVNALHKRDMVVGFIPIGKSELGNIFGIRDLEQAIKTIAFRRIEEIDLGFVNGYYFLSKLNFGAGMGDKFMSMFDSPDIQIKFSADEKFQATQSVIGGLIINSRANAEAKAIGDPTDGLLDVLLLPQQTKLNTLMHRHSIAEGFYEKIPKSSVLHVKKIEIAEPNGMPIKINDRVVAKTPATVTIAPKMLRMIVGKDREF